MLIRPIHQELEAWKWLAIISLAAVLSLALATVVGAKDAPTTIATPKPLPAEIEDWARPMPEQNSANITEAYDLGCEIWRILELHRIQSHAAAIVAWNELTVPQEVVVWKWIALGQASIATERFEKAEEYLKRAIDRQPDNALAYYFRGVLRLQQAFFALDWSDVLTSPDTRLVGLKPQPFVPNTKAMYELAATMDFEKAIELASTNQIDKAIVPLTMRTAAALEPTVGDLVLALGAENFEAKSHNALSELFLKRGALELAEQHMDEAAAGGLEVVYGYRDLGDEYRARGQDADAMRAYLKATRFSSTKLDTFLEVLRSFRDALN